MFTHLTAFIEHPLRARIWACCADVIVEEGSIRVLKELSVQSQREVIDRSRGGPALKSPETNCHGRIVVSRRGDSREHYPKGQRLRRGLVVEGLGGFFISCVPAEVQKVRCLPSQGDKCCRDCSGRVDIITVTNIILVTCSLGMHPVELQSARPNV